MIADECPYFTPCGWCSRQNKLCDIPKKSILYRIWNRRKMKKNSRK